MTTKLKAAPEDYLGREYVITRDFVAPRELVFEAWTDAKHVAQWWGPRGFTNPACEWEAVAGRAIHVVMRGPNGVDYPMGGEFREIVPPERLVISCGALNEKGEMLFEFLHAVSFVERNGTTTVTVKSRVTKTTAEANRYMGGFEAGMTQSLVRLGDLLDRGADVGASTAGSDREIVISRVFDAPRELVWEAWTDPAQVVKWWGPRGFTTIIETMNVKPGGIWKHVMRGPDGTEYPNESIFTEVVKPERIVYTQGCRKKGGPEVQFMATWSFDAVEPGKTRLTIRQVYPSAEMRDTIVREYGAVEGGKQCLARLGEHLVEQSAAGPLEKTMSSMDQPFVISRIFDAPRELVWQAFTDPQHMKQWWGPKGCTVRAAKMDLRPGGTYHYCMATPDGHEMWGKFVYREIVAPERIVFINSFSDEKGGLTRHPMSATWPLEMLSVFTFAEEQGKTRVTIEWTPWNATDEERKTFDVGRAGMHQGWGGTLDQLGEYLAKR